MRSPLPHLLFCLSIAISAAVGHANKPNVIIINMDDMGYADVGVFGAANHPDGDPLTPNMDLMADEGARMTSFYAASNICSPSRAGLLTGCYAPRVGVPSVYLGGDTTGLSRDTFTIAETLKEEGYATAIIGKWHIGHEASLLPNNHGFDYFYGLPFSHDVSPNGILPFYEDQIVIEENPDISLLTKRYTNRAVQYIEENRDEPFFLYLAHNMPHTPLAVSEEFDTSEFYNETDPLTGARLALYADVMRELDWSVGSILEKLETEDIAENTLVILTSDNGPSLKQYKHAGNAAPFREGKGTSFEGGHRVVGIAWWPGTVNPNELTDGVELSGILSQMDLYPTITNLAGADLPSYPIDGIDIYNTLTSASDTATSPRSDYFYYVNNQLEAYRSGHLKKHITHNYRSNTLPLSQVTAGKPKVESDSNSEIIESIFDLSTDPGETTPLTASELPDLATQLVSFQTAMDQFDASLVANSIPEGTHVELGADIFIPYSSLVTVDQDGLSPATGGNNSTRFDDASFSNPSDFFVRSGNNNAAQSVQALIDFDVSSVTGREILQATLYFKGHSINTNSNRDVAVEVYQVTSDWAAGSSPAPSYDQPNTGTLLQSRRIITGLSLKDKTAEKTERFYSIDVTAAVKSWVDQGDPNHGLLLKLSDNSIQNGLAIKTGGGPENNAIHLRVKTEFESSIQAFDKPNESMTIQWTSSIGADYDIEHSTDLRNWTSVLSVLGANVNAIIHNEDITLSAPTFDGPNNFFRIQKLN